MRSSVNLDAWTVDMIAAAETPAVQWISTLTSERDLAITLANDNAAAAKELEATYKTQIAALEVLSAETAVAEALSRTFNDDIATVDDIEIPDSLAKPFLKRFGGKP